MRIVAGELARAEDAQLYSICPDCLVLRLVVKGGGFECKRCWWDEYRSQAVLEKSVEPEVVIDKVRLTRAEVVYIDGPDPLEVVAGDEEWGVLLRELGELGVIRVVKTLGLVEAPSGLRGLVDAVVVELAVFAPEAPPRGYTRVYDFLDSLPELGVHYEILFPYAKRGAKTILSDIARRRSPLTVVVLDDALWDEAYRAVKKLRDEEKLPVFLHNDTSYTVMDFMCPYCGEVLVERRPWRVVRRYEPPEKPGPVECPKCGRRVPLLDRRPARRPSLRRRVVVL